jgi:acyl carrier protein
MPRVNRHLSQIRPTIKQQKEVNCMAGDVNVEETVKKIVCERLDKKPEEVTNEARFIEDLGADSLDLTELLMALEEEFNIDIDDEANQIETVADAIKYIKSKM